MTYRLEISSEIHQTLADIVNYLYYQIGGVGNPLVAQKFLREYREALDKLSQHPEIYSFCPEEELLVMKERRIRFSHLRYKIVYHISGDVVVIDAIFHSAQDAGKMLEE